jgi:hypothetical protein
LMTFFSECKDTQKKLIIEKHGDLKNEK